VNKKRRDALKNDYKILLERFWNVHEEWLEGTITTGRAIEKQRMLRMRMQEIDSMLEQPTDEKERDDE